MKAKDYFAEPLQLKLAEAIEQEDVKEAAKLIKQGAEVNAIGRDDIRPLFWAMAKNSTKGFEILLKHGADPNVIAKSRTKNGRPLSVMELAAVAENPEFLRLALEHGGNANLPVGNGGRTVIYQAILNERMQNVSLLVKHKADLSHRDTDGFSPAMTAASAKNYDMVFLFIENGADPLLKNSWGLNLIGILKEYGTRGIAPGSEEYQWYLKVVAELKKRGLWE